VVCDLERGVPFRRAFDHAFRRVVNVYRLFAASRLTLPGVQDLSLLALELPRTESISSDTTISPVGAATKTMRRRHGCPNRMESYHERHKFPKDAIGSR
jgi:hypothetical protein